jgi:hypothetical protein
MILELDQRTRSHFEDDEHTSLDYVDQWISGGDTLIQLAREIAEDNSAAEGLLAQHITRYLSSIFGEAAVSARIQLARRRGAHALAERNLDTADEVKGKDDVPAAKLKIDTRIWLAGKWNRDELGESKAGVNVQINVAQLHVDAMRKRAVTMQVRCPSCLLQPRMRTWSLTPNESVMCGCARLRSSAFVDMWTRR